MVCRRVAAACTCVIIQLAELFEIQPEIFSGRGLLKYVFQKKQLARVFVVGQIMGNHETVQGGVVVEIDFTALGTIGKGAPEAREGITGARVRAWTINDEPASRPDFKAALIDSRWVTLR